MLGLDASSRETFYRELVKCYGDHPKLILVSSHLIDELAEILEEVVILKNGEVRLAEPVESVLSLAYSVSGDSQAVDEYCNGKNVIREENIGKSKTATIFQKRESADKDKIGELGLEITPGRLQELFVSLINS
jgi:ABC-2 type transport system ATP-binding protein